jgi:hypothetical protein
MGCQMGCQNKKSGTKFIRKPKKDTLSGVFHYGSTPTLSSGARGQT